MELNFRSDIKTWLDNTEKLEPKVCRNLTMVFWLFQVTLKLKTFLMN